MKSLSNANRKSGGEASKGVLRAESVTRGLGWFSLALGVAELIAPRKIARAVGTNDSAGLVRLYGLRELVCGIGILASRNAKPFLWARVGGDVLDLTTLAASANTTVVRDQSRVTRAAVNVMGLTVLDLYAAQQFRLKQASHEARGASVRDYGSRSGFPRTPSEMRGAALANFNVPRDMRTPEALQPYTRSREVAQESAV